MDEHQPPTSDGLKTDSPKVEKVYQYTVHNFDAMNSAIENEVQKQALWNAVYYSQRFENVARVVLYLVLTLSALALSATLIWWLLQPANVAVRIAPSVPAEQLGLNELASNQVIPAADAPFTDTSFTVFQRTLAASGETVVTGKTYEPDSLSVPVEQYCYLESAGSAANVSAIPLASYVAGKVAIETDDAALRDYVSRYCRFVEIGSD